MQRAPAEHVSVHHRLLVAGAIIAMTGFAAVPAHAQAQSDTATSAKKDSAAAKPAPAAAAGLGSVQIMTGGRGIRIGDSVPIMMGGRQGVLQITGLQIGDMVLGTAPATPQRQAGAPQIRTDADSTKADSTKAAAADSAVETGKKP